MKNFENDKVEQVTDTIKKVEKSCGKIKGNMLLCTSLGMLAVAAGLKCLGHRHSALLVAQSGASLFLFGAYTKLVRRKTPKPTLQ